MKWIGLDSAGLDWVRFRLDWIGLHYVVSVGLDWVRLGWVGEVWILEGWIGDWIGD